MSIIFIIFFINNEYIRIKATHDGLLIKDISTDINSSISPLQYPAKFKSIMSYITYSPNEIVYIKEIGYATLINCGSRAQISQKVQAVPSKKESIYFDPDLFNCEGDSNVLKKSQFSKSDDQKNENKVIETSRQQPIEKQIVEPPIQQKSDKQQTEVINIIQARLEGCSAMVYTSDKNISKSIILVVKSFLITKKEQIIIEIEISKTIDTLKKQIFTQIGQQISYYYNIKLFVCNPSLTELNAPSKTITQCQIKDHAKLILTADYAYSFRPISQPKYSKYKVTLTNNTIVSSKIVEQPKKVEEKVPIPLPPPPPSSQNKVDQKKPQDKIQAKLQKVQQVKQPKVEQLKVEQVKKQEGQGLEQQKLEIGPLNAKCGVQFTSGLRYWQIKIEKLPTEQEDLVIGVCVQSNDPQAASYWRCDYAWAYQVISGKKIAVERDQTTNSYEEELWPYGYAIRQNDTIGVLLHFKGKKASLTFYKNLVSCGQAFAIQLPSLKGSCKLIPFVNIGGECQITLDSKASMPLDAYRSK